MTPRRAGWGRGPLVLAGVVLCCLLGALVAVPVGAIGHAEEVLLLAAVLLLLGLLASAALVVALVSDRFPRRVLQRLDELELRVEGLARHGVGTEGAAAAPHPPAPTEATPPVGAAPSAPPVAAPAPAPPSSAPTAPPPPDAPPAPVTPPPPGATRPTGPPRGSWELALGGRWLGRLGILVLLVGVALFLKFGWDQGWFRPSPEVRVLLGVVLGGALLAAGEAARRREAYQVLAQVLTAGGVGALYLSAWAAHGLYALVGAVAAFTLLAAAAGVGVTVAVVTGERAVALLATGGGLLVPFLVELQPVPAGLLLPFLVLLDLAVLAVAAFRRWPELGALALLGTAANLAVPLAVPAPPETRLRDAGVLLLLMVIFLGVSLAAAWRRRRDPGLVEAATLGLSALLGWAAGLWRLDGFDPAVRGAWTLVVLLAVVLVTAGLLDRLGRTGATRWVLGAVGLVLAAALPPVVWEGAAVAAAWAAEAAVLTVVAVRTGLPSAARAAAVVAAMAAVAAVAAADSGGTAFVGGEAVLRLLAAGLLGFVLAVAERRRAAGRGVELADWLAPPAAAAAAAAWVLPELDAFARRTLEGREAELLALGLGAVALALLAGALLAAWPWRPGPLTLATGGVVLAVVLLLPVSGPSPWLGLTAAVTVLAAAAVVPALAWRARSVDRGPERALAIAASVAVGGMALVRGPAGWPGEAVASGAVLPALAFALAGLLLLSAAAAVRAWPDGGAWREVVPAAGWVVLVVAASRLLAGAVALAGAEPDARRVAVVALSVLWGLCGLALVLLGLWRGAAHGRWVGLALLTVTAAKVFLVDLATAPTVIRIVAFLATGGALVAGSFLYARFRGRLEDYG